MIKVAFEVSKVQLLERGRSALCSKHVLEDCAEAPWNLQRNKSLAEGLDENTPLLRATLWILKEQYHLLYHSGSHRLLTWIMDKRRLRLFHFIPVPITLERT